MDIQNIINYYRDCYMADNRDLSIWNFISNKVQYHTIVEEREELVTDFLPYLPIDEEKAEKISKELQLYQKEKDLVYCSFFILGKRSSFGKKSKMCAPLFTYPAKLVTQGEITYLQIDISGRKINYSVIASIRDDDSEEENFYETLYNEFPRNEIDENNVAALSIALKKYIPGLDTTSIVEYPQLIDENKLKKMLQPKQLEKIEGYKLVPASGFGLVDKSNDTLGIINELTAMGRSSQLSDALISLFTKQISLNTEEYIPGRVPTILSNSQQKIMKSAHQYPFTLVVGPPGTGKSYTIAAMAIEHISKGKSVLIASRTEQAVDVLAEKIESQLGIHDVIIRGGKWSHNRRFIKYLRNLLSGADLHPDATKQLKSELEKYLNKIDSKLNDLEVDFMGRASKEIEWGNYLVEKENNSGLFTQIKRKYIHWQNRRKTPHWQLIKEIENQLDIQLKKTKKLIEVTYGVQVKETLKQHRQYLNHFLQAISKSTRQEKHFAQTNMQIILKTFPVWLVKMSDMHKLLPPQTEMFDVAIIDEATQCDIASCLPVMQRAKRVVFAGDPNQLRHVSFLSRARQDILQQKHELIREFSGNFPKDLLNYRDKSILDVVGERAVNQEQVIFLEEHYRSTPQLIEFSNKMFYSETLRIMTSKPGLCKTEGINLILAGGVRTKQGYNKEEADFVIKKLEEIIENQQSLPTEAAHSVGILSPLRAQADYVGNLINKKFSLDELKKHNISAGTAYSFQGEERDVMFISFALDNQSHPSAFYHLNKPDVFNVSITRARSQVYLIYSVDVEQLKPDSLWRKYLENYLTAEKQKGIETPESHDRFLQEVKTVLTDKGFKVWEAYPVAGLEIDIVFQHNNTTFGIDLIGYPGAYEDVFSLERYKMLQRAGIRIFPLPYTYWVAQKDDCIEELMQWIA